MTTENTTSEDFQPAEALANKLIDIWIAENKCTQIPWEKAVKITGVVCNWPAEQIEKLLNM